VTHWAGTSGVRFPADPETLIAAGPDFLTAALRSFGALPPDNAVAEITRFESVSGGSTGRKALLDVRYLRPCTLPTELFVKFSRDLDNPDRDHGRTQMQPEVLFAQLSRDPGFPVPIPRPLFASYDDRSGTGMLLTERIVFGRNGIESPHQKCMDYKMDDQLGHYRAMLTAVARLAGTQRAGRLDIEMVDRLRPDMRQISVGERIAPTPERLARRMSALSELASTHPGLLPDNVRSNEFLARASADLPRLHAAEPAIWDELDDPDLLALCHWNANVDNAWFWRDDDGVLRCGLMDWGAVGQMNIAMAIWGSLCSAETSLWNAYFDNLLALFAAEFHRSGGPLISVERLRRHVLLYAAVMGITWLLDVPRYVMRVPGLTAGSTPRDQSIVETESVRCRLLMMTNLLNLWDTYDFGALAPGTDSHTSARGVVAVQGTSRAPTRLRPRNS